MEESIIVWIVVICAFLVFTIAPYRAKKNHHTKWFIVLVLNWFVGIIIAGGAALPLAVVYLLFFNKEAKISKQAQFK